VAAHTYANRPATDATRTRRRRTLAAPEAPEEPNGSLRPWKLRSPHRDRGKCLMDLRRKKNVIQNWDGVQARQARGRSVDVSADSHDS